MVREVENISKEEIQDKIIDSLRGKSSRQIMEEVVSMFGEVDDEKKLRHHIAGNISALYKSKDPKIEKIADDIFGLKQNI